MKSNFAISVLVIALMLAGCGPSPEEIATMTASAWTPTPIPPTATPTPTPVPYDLTIKIIDAEGNPVPGASVVLAGNDTPVLTDEMGQTIWTNLPSAEGSAAFSAQGYFASDQTFSLSRGPNELAITLERDPFGLLPSQACALDESLLYVEDFQDNQAQGWPEIDLLAQGWSIAEFTDEAGNLVASNNLFEHLGTNLQDMRFTDAVWRIRFYVDGRRAISFNWLQSNNFDLDGQHIDDSRYQIVADTDGIGIRRLTLPVLNIGVAGGSGATARAWHNLEISTYQGETQVWMDGRRIARYTDPKPLPEGGIGLELITFDSSKPETINYFDNISVCGLSAPFTSIYTVP